MTIFSGKTGHMTREIIFKSRDGSEKRRQKALMTERGFKSVLRPDHNIYRYRMIHHSQERLNPKNPKRFLLLNNWKFHQSNDGLSVSFVLQLWTVMSVSKCTVIIIYQFLQNLRYKVIERKEEKYFVNITIDPLYFDRLSDDVLIPHH